MTRVPPEGDMGDGVLAKVDNWLGRFTEWLMLWVHRRIHRSVENP